jgi:hypothetical protein
MREIKFRAWDETLKKMSKIYGFVLNLNGEIKVSIGFKVMQYTGLKDINGKEIYEGDILVTELNEILIVKWCEEDAGFNLYYKEWIYYGKLGITNEKTKLIIIGNIYENSKLLK